MNFSFHPEARDEFFDAIDYYEKCRAGLGYDFSIEVYSTIDRILVFPGAWPFVDSGIRRCITRRFPFGILYECRDENVLILAVMHLHRKPGYWKQRS
jgi:hypothetical protein